MENAFREAFLAKGDRKWDKTAHPYRVIRSVPRAAPAYYVDEIVTCASREEADALADSALLLRDTRKVEILLSISNGMNQRVRRTYGSRHQKTSA